MTFPIDLYELMPAIYRREDADLGLPLEALLDIIATEAGHIQRDITGLWDDFFIETANEWVIPYIADLVGSTPLHPVGGGWRADVASTISYRRRKGTVEMLELLAGDVTGWGARVVPFFEMMEWSQYLDHVRITPAERPGRSDRVGSVNLGNLDALDLLGGPFDVVARTADLRPFGAGRGRHNIKKIGFFLWRLRSNPLIDVTPRPSRGHPGGCHFSPLGNSAPLFTDDERPAEGERAGEADLPGPVRPLALHDDLAAAATKAAAAVAKVGPAATPAEKTAAADKAGGKSRYCGPDSHHSVAITVGDPTASFVDRDARFAAHGIPAWQMVVCDLGDWKRPPDGKAAAIDPARGRLTLHEDFEPGLGETVRVSFNYGFSGAADADLGGGPYDRRASLAIRIAEEGDEVYEATVTDTIAAAIQLWKGQADRPKHADLEITDSGTYTEGDLDIDLPEGTTLALRAATGMRPVLDVTSLQVGGGGEATLVIDGLAVVGAALRIDDGLSQLTLRHTTLVPGRSFDADGDVASPTAASILTTDDASDCTISLASSIVGPIRVPPERFKLVASDTIIDSPTKGMAIRGKRAAEYGPSCDLRQVTVLGDVRVRSIDYATDVVFLDLVEVERTQAGCIRFSYVRDDAATPKRYRCQPDMALEGAEPAAEEDRIRSRMLPRFTSRSYGNPGYGQFTSDVADELRTGAENEAEIGAFNGLREAQRVANLGIRLDEYLPAGLEPGLIYET